MVSINIVNFPWGDDSGTATADESPDDHPNAVVVCSFQDGTLAVYEDHITIERVDRSKFDDRTILADEITDVQYEGGITLGYIQVVQTGVPVDSGGLMSDPVNRNTLHFDRGGRACAKEARDAVLERV